MQESPFGRCGSFSVRLLDCIVTATLKATAGTKHNKQAASHRSETVLFTDTPETPTPTHTSLLASSKALQHLRSSHRDDYESTLTMQPFIKNRATIRFYLYMTRFFTL